MTATGPHEMAEELRVAVDANAVAQAAAKEAKERLDGLIYAAVKAGMRQVDVVKATGLTRERIRQIITAEDQRREALAPQ